MTAATMAKPALREVILDALEEAYDHHRTEIEACGHCRRSLTGACADQNHQNAFALALDYEAARRQIEDSPAALAVLALKVGAAPAARDGGSGE
jgi:hypothetical protein